jgi:hypothetical protein
MSLPAAIRLGLIIGVASLSSCRATPSSVSQSDPPDYTGQVIGPSFETGAPGLGELTLLRIVGSSPPPAPALGFARIDGDTKFVFAKNSGVDSTSVGLPGIQRAFVRVWYRGPPTSRTSSEIWGNAALVRVDSSGPSPNSKRAH